MLDETVYQFRQNRIKRKIYLAGRAVLMKVINILIDYNEININKTLRICIVRICRLCRNWTFCLKNSDIDRG